MGMLNHSESQSWYVNQLKMKMLRIRQMQKEALSELSLSDPKQKLLGNEAAINSLFRVAFIPRKKTERKPTINPLSREVLYSHEEDGKTTCTCMNRYYHKLSHLLFILLETPLYLFPKETHLFFPERLFLLPPFSSNCNQSQDYFFCNFPYE